MFFDNISLGKRLFCGEGNPSILGIGQQEIRGSAYIEGPGIFGSPHPILTATLMVGPLQNGDSPSPNIPGSLCSGLNNPYSLAIQGPSAFLGVVDTNSGVNVGGNLLAQGNVISNCGGHVLAAKKNFDIPHPSKEGWRLRHTCPEAPYNDVYIRGRVTSKKHIELPDYWKDFVETSTITVNLTPIGAHQHVIVKRIDEEKIYLQSQGNMPIDCFYHIYAERKDGEKLISEYSGSSPKDYPGNNDEYSVVGYNYDKREG